MLKQDDYIKGRLVETGWRYSCIYGGHIAGQHVMHCVANRVRVGWGSWLQVMDRLPQYMAENELPKLEHPSVWEPGFIKLLHSVDGIYDGSIPDLSKGALYWGDTGNIQNPWFLHKIIQATNDEGLRVHMRVAGMNSIGFWA